MSCSTTRLWLSPAFSPTLAGILLRERETPTSPVADEELKHWISCPFFKDGLEFIISGTTSAVNVSAMHVLLKKKKNGGRIPGAGKSRKRIWELEKGLGQRAHQKDPADSCPLRPKYLTI